MLAVLVDGSVEIVSTGLPAGMLLCELSMGIIGFSDHDKQIGWLRFLAPDSPSFYVYLSIIFLWWFFSWWIRDSMLVLFWYLFVLWVDGEHFRLCCVLPLSLDVVSALSLPTNCSLTIVSR